jgi:hypothetical protein
MSESQIKERLAVLNAKPLTPVTSKERATLVRMLAEKK